MVPRNGGRKSQSQSLSLYLAWQVELKPGGGFGVFRQLGCEAGRGEPCQRKQAHGCWGSQLEKEKRQAHSQADQGSGRSRKLSTGCPVSRPARGSTAHTKALEAFHHTSVSSVVFCTAADTQ